MGFYGRGMCSGAIPGTTPWSPAPPHSSGGLEYREEPDAVSREGNVLKKKKITISASRRLHLLKER